MKKIFKTLAVIFAAVLVFSAGSVCRCDDSPQDLKSLSGKVTNVDWVGSLLTVDGGDEITFYVPSGMDIRCGTEMVSLTDLAQGDQVLVKYVDNPPGRPKAVSIAVNKPYLEY